MYKLKTTVANFSASDLIDLTIEPSTEQQVFNRGSFKGYGIVTAEPVTSAIDVNIRPENIKRGVTILGITGTLDYVEFYVIDKTLIANNQMVDNEKFILNTGIVREEMLIL